MGSEVLFWSLFNADSEDDLHNIISKDPILSNPNNWFPYGGRDLNDRSNFGIFENQSSNPIAALVEKITNSIDSMLLKNCRLKHIDPESDKAPSTMSMAVEMFFNIKNGDFSEVSHSGRRNIAEDIQIITEGDRQKPNILVYDNGEGQHPDDFPSTFLSLSRCNKTNIPFVQGKYNQGSTGAVIFCGDYRYQLIGSKSCGKLNKRPSNEFGFTLIRKHPLSEEEEKRVKSSWYEYLCINGNVPRFNINELNLGIYKRMFITGSIIKLYSYQLPRGSRSSAVWDLWRDLNQYLYHPALPFLVYEKRGFDQKTPSKPVLGNKIRLTLDEREKKEKTITISISDSVIGEIPIEVHIFKNEVDQKEFINNKAVVFTQNGQVHGNQPRAFISNELGFSLLRDHMLVQVDCTNMKTSFRQDIFKTSRDRLNEGTKTELFLDLIINTLKNNEELKILSQNRKNKILHESIEDKGILKNIFSELQVNKELLDLLKSNDDLNIFKSLSKKEKAPKETNKPEISKYISQRFPSIFKVDLPCDNSGKRIKSIPLNGKGVITFEADVEDEYLFRPQEKGELILAILGYNRNDTRGGAKSKPSRPEDLFNITKSGPTDNSIKITFEPKSTLNVGDEIEVNAQLSSPGGSIESIFWVKIIDPQKAADNKPRKQEEENIAPPLPIRVFENAEKEGDKTWKDFGWDGNDIVKIITTLQDNNLLIEGIAINIDCYILKKYLSKRKSFGPEEIKTAKDKFFVSVYLHSLFLYSILDKINKDENTDTEIDPEDIIPIIFKPYSGFLLSSSMLQ